MGAAYLAIRARLFLVPAAVAACAIATSCGGSPNVPKTATFSAPSAASASPLPAVAPAEATAVEVGFESNGCVVSVRDVQGASCRVAKGAEATLVSALGNVARACFDRGEGRHGLLHVRAAVAGDGAVSEVVTSPGGAMSNEVAACVASGLTKARLPAPEGGSGTLLLVIMSDCAKRQ